MGRQRLLWGWAWWLFAGLALHGQLAPTLLRTPHGDDWSMQHVRTRAPKPTQLLVRLAPSAVVSGARQGLAPKQELLGQLMGGQASPLAVPYHPAAVTPAHDRLARTFVVRPPEESTAEAWLAKLRQDPAVEHAELNAIVETQQTPLPNDPYLSSSGAWGQRFADLYGIQAIQAPKAWLTSTGIGVLVAVIDTGIDLRHPDLKANLWTNPKEIAGNGIDDDGNGLVDDVRGWDYVGASITNPKPGPDPTDHHGHGTHVAGTIAAVAGNGIGVAGVAPGAKVMALKAMDDSGRGPIDALVKALLYAQAQGARVANLSLGFTGTSEVLHDAIKAVTAKGMVVVVAAGNDGSDVMEFCPAQFPEVITVGACQEHNYPAMFTNYGIRVDVIAPGSEILSCRAAGTNLGKLIGDDYCVLDGTSMATPHVSGVAALLLARRSTLSTESIRQLLRNTASKPYGIFEPPLRHGFGVVDAATAVASPSTVECHISGVPGMDGTHPADVLGLVRGSGLSTYNLEYGVGRQPTSWTLLQTGPVPQGSGVLGRLDPSQLPEGELVLRLSARDASGTLYRDHYLAGVDFVGITNPETPETEFAARQCKPGAPIPIHGYVRGTGGSYRVMWAPGVMPDLGWTADGVEMAMGASVPQEGLLATWTPAQALARGLYTLRLSWQDGSIHRYAYTVIHLEPDLYSPAWPRFFDMPAKSKAGWFQAPDELGSPVLGLGLYGIYADEGKYIERVRPDGTRLDPIPLAQSYPVQPLAADLRSTPGLELILAPDERKLSLLGADLKLAPLLEDTQRVLNRQPPIAVTLKDGTRAIAQLAFSVRGSGKVLHLIRAENGLPLPGFPVLLAEDWDIGEARGTASLMAVGDIDGDGRCEFLVAGLFSDHTYSFQCVNEDGSLRPWNTTRYSTYLRGLALADLDGKGRLDLIHTNNIGEVHVQQWDGTDRPGWPIPATRDGMGRALAAGDLDGDGKAEIVAFTLKSLRVLRADGTPVSMAWPVELKSQEIDQFGENACIADVDGDGAQEIILMHLTRPHVPSLQKPPYWLDRHRTSIEAYNLRGEKVRSWPLQGRTGEFPLDVGPFTLGDFDGDGLTELAVSQMLAPTMGGWVRNSVATLLRTGAPWRPNTHDWPGVAGDPTNRSLVRRDPTPPVVSIATPTPGATRGIGTWAEVRATDNERVAQVGLQLDGAELGRAKEASGYQFILEGTPGRHTLRAWAADAAGWKAWSEPVELTLYLPPKPAILQLSLLEGPQPCTPSDRLRVKVKVQPVTATGVVSFSWGGTMRGTASLLAGEAVWELPSLAAGTHALTASYAGDALCLASTSPPLMLNCYDFTLSALGIVDLHTNNPAYASVQLKPLGPFNGQASFTCSGQPAGITATFGPLEKNADGSYTAKLNVAKTVSTSLGMPLGGAMLCLGLLRMKRRRTLALLGAALVLAGVSACGGKGSDGPKQEPPIVYTLTVEARSGSLVRTCPVTLNVYR